MELRVRTLKSVFMVTSGPLRNQPGRQLFRILKWDGLALHLRETRKGPCPDLQENLGLELFSGDGQFFLRSRCRSVAWRRGPPGSLHNAHPALAALGLEGWGRWKRGHDPHRVFPPLRRSTMSAGVLVTGCCQCDPCAEICQANSPELQKHKLHRPQRSPCQHHNAPTSDLDAVTPPN